MTQMTKMEDIQRFGQAIGREFHPERVVLFGSHAYGTPDKDSDVDILVVMEHDGNSVDHSVAMRMKLRPMFPLDLLVRTPEKVIERLEMGDTFIRDILDHGQVLYEAPHR